MTTTKTKSTKAVLPYEVVSYAQNREDLLLFWLTGQQSRGFYVDVGANDPADDFSVTRLFYELGWTGINLEPIPRLFQKICEYRPKDINLNFGAGEKTGQLEFREYLDADGFSTFSEVDKRRLGNKYKYKDFTVPVETLANILKEHLPKNAKIDFMKVDVEGFEYEVLAGNDWHTFRPALLCIEANHVHKDWRKLIHSHGYRQVFFDGLNEYWAENEKVVQARFADYAELFLSGRIILQQRNYDHYRQAITGFEHAKRANAYLEAETEEQRRQIEALQNDVKYLSTLPIKASAKQLLKAIYRSIRFRGLRLIWGSSGYRTTADLQASMSLPVETRATVQQMLAVISESDIANINLVVHKSRTRVFLYEAVRRIFIVVRRLVQPPQGDENA